MRISILALLLGTLVSCGLEQSSQIQMENAHAWPSYEHQTASWHQGDHVGTVGLPYHSSLTAHCPAGRWYYDGVRVATGQLPPGLTIGGDGSISGVPEQEGIWHCTITVSGLRCDCGTMQKYLGNGFTMTEGFCFTR